MTQRRIFSAGLLAGGVALSALLAPGVAAASEDDYGYAYKKYEIEAKAYEDKAYQDESHDAYGYTKKYHFYADRYVGDTYVTCMVKPPKHGHDYYQPRQYDCVAYSVIYKKDKHKPDYKGYKIGKVDIAYSHKYGDKNVKGEIKGGDGYLKHAYGTYEAKQKKDYYKVKFEYKVPAEY